MAAKVRAIGSVADKDKNLAKPKDATVMFPIPKDYEFYLLVRQWMSRHSAEQAQILKSYDLKFNTGFDKLT